jgi:cold shock protein
MAERETGTVAIYSPDRGSHAFGFIRPDKGGDDAFLSSRALEKAGLNPLKRGDRVAFDYVVSRNGKPQAWNIELLAA